jgi:GMP synthase (glutamine-hydrolysing)
MKTLVALRHLAFEDLGLLEPLLKAKGWRIHYYDLGVDELWKIDLSQVDLLTVLGGPIGAEEDSRYPFLLDEVALIRAQLAMQKPMLGICLGAQLIARAMGARVKPMGHKEIGYEPLSLLEQCQHSPLAEIGNQHVLHWHGDQFDLPDGVASLAATAKCPNQAFQVGNHTLAWQFHLEVDSNRIEQWLIGHSAELDQNAIKTETLRSDARIHGEALKQTLNRVIDSWFAKASL